MPRREAGILYMGQYGPPDITQKREKPCFSGKVDEILRGGSGKKEPGTQAEGQEPKFPPPTGGGVGAFT